MAPGITDIVVRDLHDIEELQALARLFGELWREPDGALPINAHLMKALSMSGNYVAGAFVASSAGAGARGGQDLGALVGGAVAWATPPPGRELHSHITGVARPFQRQHVGQALKMHQRRWAVHHGFEDITWTFDPLLRRNAAFNLLTLGARVESYAENVYGQMHDVLNAGEVSDRLFVRWHLSDPCPVPPVDTPDDRARLVATPEDAEALRATDPDLAAQWRLRLREQLGRALASGSRVIGLTKDGSYVLAPGDETGGQAG